MELSVLVVTVGVLSGWVERPPSSFHDADADAGGPLTQCSWRASGILRRSPAASARCT